MTRVVAGVLVVAAVALGIWGSPSAHDASDLEFLPTFDRFALSEAFRRGGAVERDALAAELAPIPGADEKAVELGRDLDGDGDPDEIHFHLEVVRSRRRSIPASSSPSGCSRHSAPA
jgi:hypothetical protein